MNVVRYLVRKDKGWTCFELNFAGAAFNLMSNEKDEKNVDRIETHFKRVIPEVRPHIMLRMVRALHRIVCLVSQAAKWKRLRILYFLLHSLSWHLMVVTGFFGKIPYMIWHLISVLCGNPVFISFVFFLAQLWVVSSWVVAAGVSLFEESSFNLTA